MKRPHRPSAEGPSLTRSGFALIEVLVAMCLAAIVLVGTAEMLIRSIQIRRSAEGRIALIETVCSQLEKLKGADRSGPDLEPGRHEDAVDAGAKGKILLAWDVEEAGPGILRIVCTAERAGGRRNRVRGSVLVSRRLGF